MRTRRPAIPTAAQKRAAANSFNKYDEDDPDSLTESESESERLERYPSVRKALPHETARRMRQQLRDASRRRSGRKAMKAEMEQDGGRRLSLRSREVVYGGEKMDVDGEGEAEGEDGGQSEVKVPSALDVMPRDLGDVDGAEDDESKPGTGQVFLDRDVAQQKWDAVMRARRAVLAQTEDDAHPSNLPSSDMGLFARLPGELRNRIYRFALVEGDNTPFLISMQKETCNLGACIHMRMPTAVPGILNVCQQIRAESMPIFIAENSFKFDAEIVKARCVANWLRVIGSYGALLSKVILDVVSWEVPRGVRAVSNEKVGVHYEMALRWKTFPQDRWSLHMDTELVAKAASETGVLHEYVDKLNMEMERAGKAKEVALRDFVWSDWLAHCVWICRK